MEIKNNRIGRLALMAAMSDEAEERELKKEINTDSTGYQLAITIITGLSSDVKKSFCKSIVGCSLQNAVISKSPTQVHAVLHASLDALTGVIHSVPAEASLKLKVGIVANTHWVAVAIYGDSAFYPITNHERCGLGVMNLR